MTTGWKLRIRFVEELREVLIMHLSLVTFADRKYQGSLRRLAAEARSLGVFAELYLFDETRLGREFWTRHRDFILRNPRLFGYGLWKPYVAEVAMRQIPDRSVMLYCDAGC